METILGEILLHLRAMGRHVVDRPRPGQDGAASLAALGLSCPTDFVSLYGLIDGFDMPQNATIDECAIFPGYYMLSLAEAVTAYRSLSGNGEWRKSWFPVFASGGGDFYAVICDGASPDFGAVVGFLLGEPDHSVEFASLHTMLATISAAYAEGAFYLSDGHLEADYPAMRSIAQRMQPGFSEHDA